MVMNEIEKVIDHVWNGDMDLDYDESLLIERALRSQAEREKGCKWCNGEYDTRFVSQTIRQHASNDASIYVIETNFCPNCGKKLDAHDE
jgi:hypothetical protein